ncbi:MAG: VOC family protein [Bacteroidota bacterium]
MKLRVARHTTNLQTITLFYTELLGLSLLGSFKDHDHYDGIFLGLPGADWHLEFTTSNQQPHHQPDEDDLLVFYPDTVEDYAALINRFKQAGTEQVEAKNSYWRANGVVYLDPDGFGVVIAKNNKD